MRVLKLLTVAGVVLAVCAAAGADSIPLAGSYNGPVVMHLTNFDDGVTYPGTFVGGAPVPMGVELLVNGGISPTNGLVYPPLTKVQGIANQAGEDSWGVFRIDQILAGEVTGPNGITPVSPNVELYSDGDAGLELVGIFYSRTDLSVTFVAPGPAGPTVFIKSAGDKYEIFTQPVGTYNGGGTPFLADGASQRVAGVPNEYPTVGYDGTGTNTLLPGAQHVLTGESQPGIEAQEIFTTFTPDPFGGGNGTFNIYISLGPVDPDGAGPLGAVVGSDNPWFDLDSFPNGGAVASIPGTTADFRLKGTTEPTNKEWLVRSSDPLTSALLVPEPLTMLGVFLGVGGLAGYIRKRR
jgi:hypothetical protein